VQSIIQTDNDIIVIFSMLHRASYTTSAFNVENFHR